MLIISSICANNIPHDTSIFDKLIKQQVILARNTFPPRIKQSKFQAPMYKAPLKEDPCFCNLSAVIGRSEAAAPARQYRQDLRHGDRRLDVAGRQLAGTRQRHAQDRLARRQVREELDEGLPGLRQALLRHRLQQGPLQQRQLRASAGRSRAHFRQLRDRHTRLRHRWEYRERTVRLRGRVWLRYLLREHRCHTI